MPLGGCGSRSLAARPAAAARGSAPELARSARPPSGDSRKPAAGRAPHRSLSFDVLPITQGGRGVRASASAVRDHAVDDPVGQGLLGAQVGVALEVARDLRERLAGVLGDDLLELPPEREHLTRLDLDVVTSPSKPPETWLSKILACGRATCFPLVPPRTISAPIPIALSTHIVITSGLTNAHARARLCLGRTPIIDARRGAQKSLAMPKSAVRRPVQTHVQASLRGVSGAAARTRSASSLLAVSEVVPVAIWMA
jgi:hypothetical protein